MGGGLDEIWSAPSFPPAMNAAVGLQSPIRQYLRERQWKDEGLLVVHGRQVPQLSDQFLQQPQRHTRSRQTDRWPISQYHRLSSYPRQSLCRTAETGRDAPWQPPYRKREVAIECTLDPASLASRQSWLRVPVLVGRGLELPRVFEGTVSRPPSTLAVGPTLTLSVTSSRKQSERT